MANYSIATTKDRLSSLIDKALEGEEVVITRHGKPVAEIKLYAAETGKAAKRAKAFRRLRELQDQLPRSRVTALELKRMNEAEGAL